MYEEIKLVIGLAMVSVIFIAAEPVILLKRLLGFKEEKIGQVGCDGKRKYPIKDFITKLLYCALCSGWHIYFWTILILTGNFDIIGASTCAVIAELIYKQLNKG